MTAGSPPSRVQDRAITAVKVSFTRSYLLPAASGYLLVDTTYPGRFDEFVGKLRAQGIDLADVRFVFLTHHHDDHAGLLRDLRAANPGIVLIAQERSLPALRTGLPDPGDVPINRRVGVLVWLFNQLGKDTQDWSFPPVEVRDTDLIVSGDDFDLLGSIGIDGEILHTPGHTHDSMSIVLADGRAFVGDLAMTLLSFCGCRYRPIYVTDLDQVYQSWQKILDHGATLIYSSHARRPFSADHLVTTMNRLQVTPAHPRHPGRPE